MKTTTKPGRAHLLVGLALVLASPMVRAQTSLRFEPFKSGEIADSDLDFINIEGHVINTGSGVRVRIENNSVVGDGWVTGQNPAVARVYFDGSSEYLPNAPAFNVGSSSGGLDFVFGGSPGNMPGGNQIGFDADFRFAAAPPPPKEGINAGEFASFDFAGADYGTVLSGMLNGDVRIGVHIISAGKNGEDSVAFVSQPIPEPSAALLGAIGAFVLLRRKR